MICRTNLRLRKRVVNNVVPVVDSQTQLYNTKRVTTLHDGQFNHNRFRSRRSEQGQHRQLSLIIVLLSMACLYNGTSSEHLHIIINAFHAPSLPWTGRISPNLSTHTALDVIRKRYTRSADSYAVDFKELRKTRRHISHFATTTSLQSTNSAGNNSNKNDEDQMQQQQKLIVNGSSTMESNTFSSSSSTLPIGGGTVATAVSAMQESSVSVNKENSSIDSLSVNLNTSNNPPFLVTLDDGSKHSYTEAIQRTIGWVSAAIIFGSTLWITNNAQTGEEFFAGYLVEQSLSVDNLFVFLLLFEYFEVPIQYQDRVLNWGIYGAIVMRAIMIGLGTVALQQFRPILLVFAAILVYSSASFFIKNGSEDNNDEDDPSHNSIVKLSRSLFPSTDKFDGDRFFTIVDGIRTATPLFICMIAVEISDVVFAVDSIPAVFGVTENPLIVFSSNIFAIMGLRSLYTILSKAATDLKYLEPAVAIVLGFIGSKMIAEYMDYIIPTNIALIVVATVLSSGVGLSIWEKQRDEMVREEEE